MCFGGGGDKTPKPTPHVPAQAVPNNNGLAPDDPRRLSTLTGQNGNVFTSVLGDNTSSAATPAQPRV